MIRRLRALGGPVERNGVALITASGVASGLGFLFWALAARLFDTVEVGTATALVASMTFLANVATLGLRNGLLRFASNGGETGLRLTRRVYLVCAAAGALAAAIFIAGQPLWASGLSIVTSNPIWMLLFVCLTMGWTVFVLQDGALTALARTNLVPVVQLGAGTAKILMLFAMASVTGGIFLAFSTPAFAAVLIVSALVLRRSAVGATHGATVEIPPLPALMRYAGAEHVSALVWLAAVNLLPLIVLEQAGAEASAYYYISFTTAYFLYLVASSFSSALLVVGSRDLASLVHIARRTLRNTLLLVLVGVGIGVIVAPHFLGILGSDYAAHASLLQILLVSAIPNTVVSIALAMARAQLRLASLATLQVSVSIIVLVGAFIGLRAGGIDGVGWAWLIAQSTVALAALLTILRPIWLELVPLPVLARLDGWRQSLSRIPRARRARSVAVAVSTRIGSQVEQARLLPSSNAVLVLAAEIDGKRVVIRQIGRDRERAALLATADLQESIAADPRLEDLRDLIPRVRARFEDIGVVIEDRLPGDVWPQSRDRDEGVRMLASTIAELHRRTAVVQPGARIAAEFDERMTGLRRLPENPRRFARLSRLSDSIRDVLASTELTLSTVHGDCALGNALFSADNGVLPAPIRLTGVIDFENARRFGLPELDLGHLWLTSRGTEIGGALSTALESPGQWDHWMVDLGIARANPELPEPLVLVTAWLEHIVGEAGRSRRGVTTTWTARNVDVPLNAALHEQLEWKP